MGLERGWVFDTVVTRSFVDEKVLVLDFFLEIEELLRLFGHFLWRFQDFFAFKNQDLISREVFQPMFEMMYVDAIGEKAVRDVVVVNVSDVVFPVEFELRFDVWKSRVDEVPDFGIRANDSIMRFFCQRNVHEVGFEALDWIAKDEHDFHQRIHCFHPFWDHVFDHVSWRSFVNYIPIVWTAALEVFLVVGPAESPFWIVVNEVCFSPSRLFEMLMVTHKEFKGAGATFFRASSDEIWWSGVGEICFVVIETFV